MVNATTTIVKRNRSIEDYDRQKLAKSITAACLSLRTPAGSAETTAKQVCKHVEAWLSNKAEVTSSDIRRKAAESLLAYHPEAAYIYKKQRLLA